MLYEWILTNKELLKIVYTLVILFICAIIVLKTDRLFKISDYQGLRYMRNAFLFYALAFMSRFILGRIENPLPNLGQMYSQLMNGFFEFFIIMAGFFLFYSLIWKYVEKERNYHSLFNIKIGIFFVISLFLVFLDSDIGTYLFLYISQIILFLSMCVISLKNYIESNKKKFSFSKSHFVIILMGLISWSLNAFAYFFLKETSVIQMYAYVINMIFFLLFLFGIIRITRK